jgi:cyclin A
LTAEYIKVYGKDHLEELKSIERPVVPDYPKNNNNNNKKTTTKSSSSPPSSSNSHFTDSEFDGSDVEEGEQDHKSSSSYSSSLSSRLQRTPPRRCNAVNRKFMSKSRSSDNNVSTSLFESLQPKESTQYLGHIHQDDLTPKMRAILVDWLIELSEHFNFSNATLHVAITMADRVLASGGLGDDRTNNGGYDSEDEYADDDDDASQTSQCFVIPRDRYQLLGATCVWLACKVMETTAPKAKQIAYVSDNIYDIHQIKTMERRICNALGFAFFQEPTPYQFMIEFLRASHEGDLGQQRPCPHGYCGIIPVTKSVLVDTANYLLELGRIPFGPATEKPSLLAASAVYLARVTLGIRSKQPDLACDPNGYWTPTLEYYSGYSKQDLKETVSIIHAYQVGAEGSNLKSTYAKYRPKKYNRVAIKTAVLKENLGF